MPYQETVSVLQQGKQHGSFFVILDTARGGVTLAEFPYNNDPEFWHSEYSRETIVAERVERFVASLPWTRREA